MALNFLINLDGLTVLDVAYNIRGHSLGTLTKRGRYGVLECQWYTDFPLQQ